MEETIFFLLKYPEDYPYRPPVVSFCTNGDKIRFNPNLYINGKVCVSILNTWSGEQWSSCQTISTVLLALSTLLCSSPLLNEPGITEKHADFDTYNQIVEYKNIEIAVIHLLNKTDGYYLDQFDCFDAEVHDEFNKNKDHIKQFLELKVQQNPNPIKLSARIYSMSCTLNYPALFEKFLKMFEEKFVSIGNPRCIT